MLTPKYGELEFDFGNSQDFSGLFEGKCSDFGEFRLGVIFCFLENFGDIITDGFQIANGANIANIQTVNEAFDDFVGVVNHPLGGFDSEEFFCLCRRNGGRVDIGIHRMVGNGSPYGSVPNGEEFGNGEWCEGNTIGLVSTQHVDGGWCSSGVESDVSECWIASA